MFQPGNSESVGPVANAAPTLALVGSSHRPDAPRIALVAVRTKPIQELGSIHLPALRTEPPLPAPLLSEILLLLALCLVLRGVAKARQLLS